MSKITAGIAVSLDGYAAGPHQSRDNPFGEGVGERPHRWMFEAADENVEELIHMVPLGAPVFIRA